MLVGLNKLEKLDISKTRVSDISALKNNTTLKCLWIADTNIGKDLDVSYSNSSYSLLTKTSTLSNINSNTIKNVFYETMLNKNAFYFLDARNCKYIGYVSYLTQNPKLTDVYFSGCSNISSEEIAALKNGLKLSSSCTFPRTSDSLNANSTYLNVNSASITESDFKNISNFTKLERVWFHDVNSPIRIYKDDGITLLTQDEVNKVVNDTLSKLVNLKGVSIRIKNLSEITFVKSCQNIIYLDMWESSVGSTINGLQLLNNNCPNIKHILIPNTIICDFSLIQPLVNKCDTLNSFGYELEDYRGILCWRKESIDTLAKCTKIQNLFFSRNSNNFTYDLSNCKDLKKVNISSGGPSTFKLFLPNELPINEDGSIKNKDEYDGYSVKIEGMLFKEDNITGGFSCKSFTTSGTWGVENSSAFWSNFDEFSKNNDSYLQEIVFNSTSDVSQKIISGEANDKCSLSVLSNCTNLKKFYWYGNEIREGNFRKINVLGKFKNLEEIYFDKTNIDVLPDLSNCNSLKSINITNSNLIDISGISKNTSTSLVTINFNNNSIFDIRPLSTLKYLTSLNLENNSIKNWISSSEGDFNTINILNSLKNNYSKNVKLYIKNNYFTDFTGLEWASSK